MPLSSNPRSFRFTKEDWRLIDKLARKLGIVNVTDIIRLAIRRLAESEGIQ